MLKELGNVQRVDVDDFIFYQQDFNRQGAPAYGIMTKLHTKLCHGCLVVSLIMGLVQLLPVSSLPYLLEE